MAGQYLKRNPTNTGNRQVHTWSGWVKQSKLNTTASNNIWYVASAGNSEWRIYITNQANLVVTDYTPSGGSVMALQTERFLRDHSTWFHLLVSIDTTNSTESERMRVYIDGVRVTEFSTTTYGPQNHETRANTVGEVNYLGQNTVGGGTYQGYCELFDVFSVDGQALTPDVFGFYKDGDGYQSSGTTKATDFRSGQWSPRLPKSIKHTINRSGGFGVNGFYLPMNDSSNFGADFHCTPNSIIKLKGEDEPQPRNGSPTTSDSYASQLRSDPYAANLELAIPGIGDGLGSGFGDYSHLIKGSGSAKTVTTSGSPAHRTGNSYYNSVIEFDGSDDKLSFDNVVSNPGTQDFTYEFWAAPDDWSGTYTGLITLTAPTGTDRFETAIQSNTIQVYTDTGSWRDTGFEFPKKQWTHIAFERYNGYLTMYVNGAAKWIVTNTHDYNEAFSSKQQFGKHGSSHGDYDGLLQDLRFYTGVAKYKGGFDVSKPFCPDGIDSWRQVSNTCKNNFVTMNPNNKNGCTLSNGNLTTADATTSGGQIYSTMGSNTGKWYYEAHITDVGGSGGQLIGINPLRRPAGNVQNRTVYRSSGDVYNDSGSVQQTGTTYTTGDIIGVAWDADAKKLWFAKNGSWVYSGDPVNGGNQATAYTSTETQGPFIAYDNGAMSQVTNLNFGQNPTFSGQVTAGTNTDGNGKGLFKYAPPTGFLALCDDNLPTPAVADPGKHFKALLYDGTNDQVRPVVGAGFAPDLVWQKDRAGANWHRLTDVIRGNNTLYTNSSNAQAPFETNGHISSLDSDGFTVDRGTGPGDAVNGSGQYVAWCWKAGGPAVTNNDGSATSLVSANQEAGFSIVKFTAQTSGSITLGHGLGKKPAFWLWKDINGSTGWYIFHKNLGSSAWVNFDNNDATTGNSAAWETDPTDTVFTNGGGFVNQNDVIMYIWAEIEGYSKFAQYFGNGSSTDGPFVYCGFKPAWLLLKCVSTDGGHWIIYDSSRSSTNINALRLGANLNDSENQNVEKLGTDTSQGVDFLSNGFKIRTPGINHNQNGEEYIFAAFAESPFQTANAK